MISLRTWSVVALGAIGVGSACSPATSTGLLGGSGGEQINQSSGGSGNTQTGAGGNTFVPAASGGATSNPTGSGGTQVMTGAGGMIVSTSSGGTTSSGGVTCAGTAATWYTKGYVDNGTLCGYGYTASFDQGEVVTPPCGSAGPCFEDSTDFCLDATVPVLVPYVSADDPGTYTGVMLAFNVNEASDGKASQPFAVADASGIKVTYSMTTDATPNSVRLAITSNKKEYCIDKTVSGTAYTWDDFLFECYEGGSKTKFAGATIDAVQLKVEGSGDGPMKVTDMCITGFAMSP